MPLVSAPTVTQTAGGQNLYAVAGSIGPGGGVEQLLAGANITLSPPDGLGVVTITAAGGGGGGGVSSVTASGAGITATPTTGAVVLENTGVTSLTTAPGSGITLAGSTGSVNVSNAGVLSLVAGPGIAVTGGGVGNLTVSTAGLPVFTGYQTFDFNGGNIDYAFNVTGNLGFVRITRGGTGNELFKNASSGYELNGTITLSNAAWNINTVLIAQISGTAFYLGGSSAPTCLGISWGESLPGIPDYTKRRVRVSGPGTFPYSLDGGFSQGLQFVVLQGAV
jgi:hypothetical protein